MIVIPPDELAPQTLRALIEEFVTRDGAVHGHQTRSSSADIAEVEAQLKARKALIVFDEPSETCTIVPAP